MCVPTCIQQVFTLHYYTHTQMYKSFISVDHLTTQCCVVVSISKLKSATVDSQLLDVTCICSTLHNCLWILTVSQVWWWYDYTTHYCINQQRWCYVYDLVTPVSQVKNYKIIVLINSSNTSLLQALHIFTRKHQSSQWAAIDGWRSGLLGRLTGVVLNS